MNRLVIGTLFIVIGLFVTEAYAQRGGCSHGGGTGGTSTSTSTSTLGSTGTTATASGLSGTGDSSAVRQLLQLARQQQLQQEYEAYCQQQEALAQQEEQERQQFLAERRERLIAQRGTTLAARLVEPETGAKGLVTYHTSTLNGAKSTRLKIEVTGAPAYTPLSVCLADTKVGQIMTDSKGSGVLILSSSPKGYIQRSLPSNFPGQITAGANVSVGSMVGTWRPRSTT